MALWKPTVPIPQTVSFPKPDMIEAAHEIYMEMTYASSLFATEIYKAYVHPYLLARRDPEQVFSVDTSMDIMNGIVKVGNQFEELYKRKKWDNVKDYFLGNKSRRRANWNFTDLINWGDSQKVPKHLNRFLLTIDGTMEYFANYSHVYRKYCESNDEELDYFTTMKSQWLPQFRRDRLLMVYIKWAINATHESSIEKGIFTRNEHSDIPTAVDHLNSLSDEGHARCHSLAMTRFILLEHSNSSSPDSSSPKERARMVPSDKTYRDYLVIICTRCTPRNCSNRVRIKRNGHKFFYTKVKKQTLLDSGVVISELGTFADEDKPGESNFIPLDGKRWPNCLHIQKAAMRSHYDEVHPNVKSPPSFCKHLRDTNLEIDYDQLPSSRDDPNKRATKLRYEKRKFGLYRWEQALATHRRKARIKFPYTDKTESDFTYPFTFMWNVGIASCRGVDQSPGNRDAFLKEIREATFFLDGYDMVNPDIADLQCRISKSMSFFHGLFHGIDEDKFVNDSIEFEKKHLPNEIFEEHCDMIMSNVKHFRTMSKVTYEMFRKFEQCVNDHRQSPTANPSHDDGLSSETGLPHFNSPLPGAQCLILDIENFILQDHSLTDDDLESIKDHITHDLHSMFSKFFSSNWKRTHLRDVIPIKQEDDPATFHNLTYSPAYAVALYSMFKYNNVFIDGFPNLCVLDHEYEIYGHFSPQECYEKRVEHCANLVKNGQHRFECDNLKGKGIPDFSHVTVQELWDDLPADKVMVTNKGFQKLFPGEKMLSRAQLRKIRVTDTNYKLIGPSRTKKRSARVNRSCLDDYSPPTLRRRR